MLDNLPMDVYKAMADAMYETGGTIYINDKRNNLAIRMLVGKHDITKELAISDNGKEWYWSPERITWNRW